MAEKKTSKSATQQSAEKKKITSKKGKKSSPKKRASSVTASPKKIQKKQSASKKKSASEAFAIIETGGKQYKVSEGDMIQIEKLADDMKEGSTVSFEKVLLFDDGKNTKIGTPYLPKKRVEGELVKQGRDTKISVIRFRAKSRHFKRKGHRQPYMKVKITKV